MAREIISRKISKNENINEEKELKYFHFKNDIWNKILSAKEFEQFDANEYFRLLELYKDPNGTGKDILSINPVRIEQKLALIEAIELRFSHMNQLHSIQDDIEELNVYKLKKLQSLVKKFDLSKNTTRENLEEFSTDFFLILKGPPVSLFDYFTNSKSALMNKRIQRVLEEDMLVMGLKGSLLRIPEKEDYTRIEKARYYIKKVMKFKLWRYLVVPYDLPWIDRIKVSDELLEKILMDGLDAHSSDLIKELKNQNAIDHYYRFRKVYRSVAFGVGVYYYLKYKHEKENNDEEAKKKFMDGFKRLSDSINDNTSQEKSEQDLKDAQFERVLKAFKERYHEDPTPQEFKELHLKIYGD